VLLAPGRFCTVKTRRRHSSVSVAAMARKNASWQMRERWRELKT
jgi:hypothetical protein